MPELTTSSTAPGSLPTLSIPPYGAEIFTDFARDKRFVVLFYRHDGAARAKVLAWIGSVQDDLLAAGLHVSDACEIQLTADQARSEPVGPKTKYRCHLKVPVQIAGEREAETQAFLDGLRAHLKNKG